MSTITAQALFTRTPTPIGYDHDALVFDFTGPIAFDGDG